jgi:hypothetical protein
MWLSVRMMETPGWAITTTLLPELLVLVASSLLVIFFPSSFLVLGMVLRKASWAALECWQEARKKRIVSTNEKSVAASHLSEKAGKSGNIQIRRRRGGKTKFLREACMSAFKWQSLLLLCMATLMCAWKATAQQEHLRGQRCNWPHSWMRHQQLCS